MNPRFLFPHWSRYLGWVLVVLHIPVALLRKALGFDHPGSHYDDGLLSSHHVFFMATTLLMAVGLFLVSFSKERIEDEQIMHLRLDSLQWAIYFNYLLLIVSLVLSTDTEHILLLNLLVPLLFFIIRFRWKIYRNNRLIKEMESRHEK